MHKSNSAQTVSASCPLYNDGKHGEPYSNLDSHTYHCVGTPNERAPQEVGSLTVIECALQQVDSFTVIVC